MHDNTLYIPNILAYTFVGLFVILLGFVITGTTHKIYRLMNKKNPKSTIESLIEPTTAEKVASEMHLSKSKMSLHSPDSPLKQLRKSKLG